MNELPCMVREATVIKVVAKTGPFSRNLQIKETFAATAKNIEMASIASRPTGVFCVSSSPLRPVGMYHLSVRPEISSRMEKGITSPTITGRIR